MRKKNTHLLSFKEAFSFQSLLSAHLRCRCSKSHKREVVKFELNLHQNLLNLSNSILSGKYFINHYRKFTIYEPKERHIESLSYGHRLVQMSLCYNILEPLIERHLVEHNCACRAGKGTDYARAKLYSGIKKLSLNGPVYALKCDISKFFASIDHNVLFQKLCKLPLEHETLRLLKLIIDSSPSPIGLPIGNQTSQWFSLLYLNSVDRLIKERLRCKQFVRYMDDFVLLSNDKKYLAYCLQEIRKECTLCRLHLNSKTRIIPLYQGVVFLGKLYIISNNKPMELIPFSAKQRLKLHLKKYLFYIFNRLVSDKTYLYPRLVCYRTLWKQFYSKNYLFNSFKNTFNYQLNEKYDY